MLESEERNLYVAFLERVLREKQEKAAILRCDINLYAMKLDEVRL